MKVLVLKQQPLSGGFERTRRTAIPADVMRDALEERGPEAGQAIMGSYGLWPEVAGESPEGWGSLVPDIQSPHTSLGSQGYTHGGAWRNVAIHPQSVEKVGLQQPSHIALGYALSQMGYPILPEIPVEHKTERMTRQRRAKTIEDYGEEKLGPTLSDKFDFNRRRDWSEWGARQEQDPLARLIRLWDLKASNIGVEPGGDLVGIDPYFHDMGFTGTQRLARKLVDGKVRPTLREALGNRLLEEAHDLTGRIPKGKIKELRENIPDVDFFRPWAKRSGFDEREIDSYKAWKIKMDNWLKFLESIQELPPEQQRLYNIG